MKGPINNQKSVDARHSADSAKKTDKIHIKPSKEGTLHTAMGVKQGQKIGRGAEQSKLAAAKKSGNVSLEKKLVFALNFGKKK